MVRTRDAVAQHAEPATDEVARLTQAGLAAERRGDQAAALKAFEKALKALGQQAVTTRHADINRLIGSVYRERGETERAEHYYRASLSIAEEIAYVGGVAHAVNLLAVTAVRRGELDDAEEQFQIASRKAHECGETRLLGMVEQNLGVLANIRGDLDTALVRYRAALGGFRAAQDFDAVATVLNNIGVMQRDLKQWDDAQKSFDDAIAIAKSIGNVGVANSIELNVAEMAAAQARWNEAGRVGKRIGKFAHQHNMRPREAEALRIEALVAAAGDRLSEAERLLGEANAICIESEDRLLEAEIARDLGDVLRRQNRVLEARAFLSRSFDLFRAIGAAHELQDVAGRLEDLNANS